ncbi:MAG: S1 RNA-binding domain-containing protein [Candidatus Dormibacteraeota bacterium]|nr:S1 RNA-binding domain-containing protein [Candidatus Dormibacteraeota bacterium]
MAVTPGTVVEGTVVGITNFGAFVQIEGAGTGLVHISEIANEYVRDVNNHLKMNEKIKVKVLNVDATNGKMDLSLKQAAALADGAGGGATVPMGPPVLPRSYRRGGRGKRELPEGADPVFEEKLSKFMKTSEERLLDIKRNLEAKRGGRFK